MQISEQLASALHEFVRASDAAAGSPSDRQTARRVIEQATVVASFAKRDGFGNAEDEDR